MEKVRILEIKESVFANNDAQAEKLRRKCQLIPYFSVFYIREYPLFLVSIYGKIAVWYVV